MFVVKILNHIYRNISRILWDHCIPNWVRCYESDWLGRCCCSSLVGSSRDPKACFLKVKL